MYSSPVGWCCSCNLLCASWEAAHLPQTNNSIEGARSLGCLPVQALKLEQLCEAKEAENNTKAISLIYFSCNFNRQKIPDYYSISFTLWFLNINDEEQNSHAETQGENYTEIGYQFTAGVKSMIKNWSASRYAEWVRTCDLALTH